jgi:hypothetical protein
MKVDKFWKTQLKLTQPQSSPNARGDRAPRPRLGAGDVQGLHAKKVGLGRSMVKQVTITRPLSALRASVSP